MTVQRPPPGLGADQTRAAPAPLSELRKDVHPLGEALKERVADVLDLTVARTGRSAIDAAAQNGFERICTSSTIALDPMECRLSSV